MKMTNKRVVLPYEAFSRAAYQPPHPPPILFSRTCLASVGALGCPERGT